MTAVGYEPEQERELAPGDWQNRIIGHGNEPPESLLANPLNWRIHPMAQQEAMSGVLDKVGWVQQIIVNQRTGHVVDGHLRASIAISQGVATVPVVYVDLSEEEEAIILATYDPLGGMAVADREQLEILVRDMQIRAPALDRMLDDLRKTLPSPRDGAIRSTVTQPSIQEGRPPVITLYAYCCPKCKHEWNGDPRP